MKKYQIEVEIYYNGCRSKAGEIGHLTIQFGVDKAYYKKHKTFIRSKNSYHVEGERDIVPVNYTTLFVSPNSAEVVKEAYINYRYDAGFSYKITENTVEFSVEGLDAFFNIGLPKCVKE